MSHLSEVQIDGEALRHNVTALRSLIPGVAVAAVVKGNAYGHGLAQVVAALEGRVEYFQIDDLEELRALRSITQASALVFGYVERSGVEEALSLGAELTVYDTERLEVLSSAGQRLNIRPRIHLKIDALLGRQGVLPSDLPAFLEKLRRYPNIELVSAYSHFANIEDTDDLTHARAQSAVFERCYAAVCDAGWSEIGRHESATSGAMAYEGKGGPNNLVRLGIGVYGLYPSATLGESHRALRLKPALRWVTHLAQVKTLPADHSIGYGLTHVTGRATRIGIVPQGYSDGFDRRLSNLGRVLVRGKSCPVLGRIAMNMFAVDLSQAPDADAEDEVVLLGSQEGARIAAEEIADRIGTINYEITTRISPLLPRVLR